MPSAGPKIDLDALRKDAGTITVARVDHVVRQVDGGVYDVMLQMQRAQQAGEAVDVLALYAAAHRCVPSLTDEQVRSLTAEQAGAILAIASNQAEQVAEFAAAIAAEREDSELGKAGAAGGTSAPPAPPAAA